MEKVANSAIEPVDSALNIDREVLEGGSIPLTRCQLECLAERKFTCRSFEYMDRRGFGDICTISERNYDDPQVRLVNRLGVDIYQWKCGGLSLKQITRNLVFLVYSSKIKYYPIFHVFFVLDKSITKL